MLYCEIAAFVVLVAMFVGYKSKMYHLAAMEKKELESLVYTHSNDGIFISDDTGMILSVNAVFEKLTGYMASEIVNQKGMDINPEIHSREFYTLLQQSIVLMQSWEGEISDCHKDGSIFYKWLSIKKIIDHNHQCRYIGTFLDMTKIEEANQKLWYQANFDTMTDLPNRNMFFEHLKKHIDKATRYGKQLALIYVDLTNIEEINDAFGHMFGDLVLKEAAKRMVDCMEKSELFYRIGGVEFAIITANDDVDRIANKIIKEMSSMVTLEDSKNFRISTNIGIAVYPDDGLIAETLLNHADQAMYLSKKEGKNGFSHFKQVITNDLDESFS